MELDQRPTVWDASNLRHIERDHAERRITSDEVDEALTDPRRIEAIEEHRGVKYHEVVGMTNAGRLFFVVWVDHPEGRYPVHARRAGRRMAGRYYR